MFKLLLKEYIIKTFTTDTKIKYLLTNVKIGNNSVGKVLCAILQFVVRTVTFKVLKTIFSTLSN